MRSEVIPANENTTFESVRESLRFSENSLNFSQISTINAVMRY